jgi:hypothetical protein
MKALQAGTFFHGQAQGMKEKRLSALQFFALLFLLPGLGGLITSAVISTHYLDTLPKWPAPEEQRMTPRLIHGQTVYQTPEEDRRLTLLEDASIGVFILGLGLSVLYLEKWSTLRARENEEEGLSENAS